MYLIVYFMISSGSEYKIHFGAPFQVDRHIGTPEMVD